MCGLPTLQNRLTQYVNCKVFRHAFRTRVSCSSADTSISCFIPSRLNLLSRRATNLSAYSPREYFFLLSNNFSFICNVTVGFQRPNQSNIVYTVVLLASLTSGDLYDYHPYLHGVNYLQFGLRNPTQCDRCQPHGI